MYNSKRYTSRTDHILKVSHNRVRRKQPWSPQTLPSRINIIVDKLGMKRRPVKVRSFACTRSSPTKRIDMLNLYTLCGRGFVRFSVVH
jgi:hypothetical protein